MELGMRPHVSYQSSFDSRWASPDIQLSQSKSVYDRGILGGHMQWWLWVFLLRVGALLSHFLQSFLFLPSQGRDTST